MKQLFIAGTDTEVGKTQVATLILRTLAAGKVKHGWKPIAAGCEQSKNGQYQNDDALQLLAASNTGLDYEQTNPIALTPAVAPHIAAAQVGLKLNLKLIEHYYQQLPTAIDTLIIEGAGGWLLPLNQTETLADWVAQHKIPVLLVVGMKLGCLNHALLTWQALKTAQVPCIGWVANSPSPKPMLQYQENIHFLKSALPVPLLAEIPYIQQSEKEKLQPYSNLGEQVLQLV